MLYGYFNSPFVSNQFSDAAIPPSSVASPVISGSGVIGQTLSTTNGTWSGTLPITYTYQWNRNGSVILGATFNTYTLVIADGSTSITCTVTATNAGGSLSADSNSINVVPADADANAFIAAAAITNPTQKNAINTLVVDLKGYGIWSKMKAIYPFIGGTASQHKYNLRNPIDSDSAFRLVFNGGITHDANGITGNGVNAFANTFLNDNTLNIDNKHIAMYQRNILSNLSGAQIGLTPANRFYLNYQGVNYSNIGVNSPVTTVSAPQRGMFLMSKTTSGTFKYFQNALTPITKTGANFPQASNYFILAQNNGAAAVDHSLTNLALASIGDGFSDAEYTNYSIAVNTFQTTLSRNV
jgi:hypothetical protein